MGGIVDPASGAAAEADVPDPGFDWSTPVDHGDEPGGVDGGTEDDLTVSVVDWSGEDDWAPGDVWGGLYDDWDAGRQDGHG